MVRIRMLGLAALALGLLAQGEAFAAGGRVLNTSDQVTIRVVSQPDMDTTSRVEPDGTVQFPYIGRVKAAGVTEDSLARTIEHRLAARQIVTDPHVLIEITNFGAEVSVQGQVGQPGLFTIDRATTLPQILARAGGLRQMGTSIVLKRGGVTKRYDGDAVVTGKEGSRVVVENNDEIFVDLAPFYYVYGYVGRTGEFPLTRPITVQQAIAIAGGLGQLGSDWRLKIKRKSANGQTEEVPASLDDQVQANDTIVVNERLF